MAELFTISGLFTLGMLVLLQAVLGFDNLLYISLESKRVADDKQSMVRKLGIGVAIALRIVLLFVVVHLITLLEDSFFELHNGYMDMAVSGHSLIVFFGGAFILWTAIKEIHHLLSDPEVGHGEEKPTSSVGKAIALIVVMNLVFSFDSILSAMALSKNMWIMSTAIIISGILMIVMADKVAEFIKKNRMFEVLGLFILFIVGVMLVSEGGELAHVSLFGHEVHHMPKSTFYFVLATMIIVDVVQTRYQKRLVARQEKKLAK
ncbi:TerC family protein [Allorhodopirellula solitaria]|uniref:Integral membrane protein TerC family protein n=1 Tax=Allorhodopirellula solitaria TaxID=2527987 RepID=A0A5C5X075_9BACT|nr:TerC family protein [Allorhodopirellula solitaria]TWT56346.1 Integral membrane protein TerC family protein [Allorhodopirellula solitaria]